MEARVKLVGIPRHFNSARYQKADVLARKVSNITFIRPDPICWVLPS